MGGNRRFSAGRLCKGSSAHDTGDLAACASEDDLLVFTVVALYAQEPALWSLDILVHVLSLLEFEFLCPETGSLMCFLAYGAAVSECDTLRRLVSTRYLGEFSAVPYTGLSLLLSCNASQGGSFAFLNPFCHMLGVGLAEGAISPEFFWNLHILHLLLSF